MKTERLKEHFKLVSAVHLFLVRDEKILLLRRFNTGYRDREYSVPAGHLDGNEPASMAMVREAKEETGIEIKFGKLRMVHLIHRLSQEERLDFFFTAEVWNGVPTIMEPKKCDELRWFPIDKLPDNMVPYVRKAIGEYRDGNIFSEFGWIVPDEE